MRRKISKILLLNSITFFYAVLVAERFINHFESFNIRFTLFVGVFVFCFAFITLYSGKDMKGVYPVNIIIQKI